MKPLNSSKFLAVYSAIVTVAFAFTVWHGAAIVAAQSRAADHSHVDFDQLTVHRINVVEPDGTLRMVISDRARFPGQFLHGTETGRPDRSDSAGVMFMNDEGTENGGLIFGGHKSKDGSLHSFGHLSFDEYGSDQTLNLDVQQDGRERFSLVSLNDMPLRDFTKEEDDLRAKLRALPSSPAKEQAFRSFRIEHPDVGQKPRIQLIRSQRGTAALRIADALGNDRIEIGVDDQGNPSISFRDSNGKVTRRWPN